MTTPRLHLETAFVLDARGRITGTREPNAERGPRFILVRSRSGCVWAVRADVPDDVAAELDQLARTEPPLGDLSAPPIHAKRYLEMLRSRRHEAATPPSGLPVARGFVPSASDDGEASSGPCFTFPDDITDTGPMVVALDDDHPLERHFRGWTAGEVAARSPVIAIVDGVDAISVCFGARISDLAVEAGVETAAMFRGRGYASQVTSAWASAIHASGRTPLYSTSWTNTASLAVARQLGLVSYAATWSLA